MNRKTKVKRKGLLLLIFLITFGFKGIGQEALGSFKNPILSGFNPDPSICRVGDDYYLVTSSFAWYPGIPIYHSKDLVNWQLIGHGISRPEQLDFDKIKDKNGIWAVTIRYHNGLFYLITTCSDCGGNFYITAKDPAGEWSQPIWLNDAEGIDPSLLWDDDGKCYYSGNIWGGFEKKWPGQCAIWAQELDLNKQKLVGERKILTYGYANNARYTEAPHIYKMENGYLLITAEGGTDMYHSVTAHHSSSVLGPYTSDIINPVLTHRSLGKDYPVQAVGHADLVQTQNGEWWAVVLGKRIIDGLAPLARETFLCKVNFENGTPIFNPNEGKVVLEQIRPNLPWTPLKFEPQRDEFSSEKLNLKWHTIRTPQKEFYNLINGQLNLILRPQTIDSLVNTSILIHRTKDHQFSASTKLTFKSNKINEQAGLILYRTNNSYYALLKEKNRIVLIKKYDGKKEVIAVEAYNKPNIFLSVSGDNLNLKFNFGESPDSMTSIGGTQSAVIISDSDINKFNGTGIGVYASSNGKKTNNKAIFDWFEYKNDK